MFKYLNKFNILYQHQYEFRPNHNSNQPLLHLLDKIYQGLYKTIPAYTIGIFLDLKKDFYKVDSWYQNSLKKLKHYGFKEISFTWFMNYLTRQKQYVCIDGCSSSEREI